MADTRTIRPVVMSGGSGTRMWPLSRKARPKQFHALASDLTLFQETLKRIDAPGEGFGAPIILGAERHESLMLEELAAIGVAPAQLILEPMPKNTAPAIAALAVANERARPGEIVVVLPADHAVSDPAAFRQALRRGAAHAEAGRIVTFGIKPSGPETGYGYIRAGDALGDSANAVGAFVEKPKLETAKDYVASGEYYWNAGIFMFRADVMVEELARHCPETLAAVERAVESGASREVSLVLNADAFDQSIEDSIDYAVMEKTDRAAVVETDVGWSDIGSWSALWEISDKDQDGNADRGDGAVLVDAKNILALSDGPKIAAIGVEDLLIVATSDGVLVARKDAAQDVKKVVAALKDANRKDLL